MKTSLSHCLEASSLVRKAHFTARLSSHSRCLYLHSSTLFDIRPPCCSPPCSPGSFLGNCCTRASGDKNIWSRRFIQRENVQIAPFLPKPFLFTTRVVVRRVGSTSRSGFLGILPIGIKSHQKRCASLQQSNHVWVSCAFLFSTETHSVTIPKRGSGRSRVRTRRARRTMFTHTKAQKQVPHAQAHVKSSSSRANTRKCLAVLDIARSRHVT